MNTENTVPFYELDRYLMIALHIHFGELVNDLNGKMYGQMVRSYLREECGNVHVLTNFNWMYIIHTTKLHCGVDDRTQVVKSQFLDNKDLAGYSQAEIIARDQVFEEVKQEMDDFVFDEAEFANLVSLYKDTHLDFFKIGMKSAKEYLLEFENIS